MTNGHFASCINHNDCWCEVRLYIGAFVIGLIIFFFQLAGGIFSGSLSLLGDTGHVFIDEIALGFTIITAWLVKLHRHHEEKIRATGGYANGVLFFIIGGWILHEALDRMKNPHEVAGILMMSFASIGALGNFAQHQLIEGRSEYDDTVTHSSIKWHILSDLFQSISVVIGAIVIWITGNSKIDVWLSIAISILMFWWGLRTFVLIFYKKTKVYHNHHDHHGHHHH